MNDEWTIVAKIPSSDRVASYAIRRGPAGDLTCECEEFRHRQKCRHVDLTRKAQWMPGDTGQTLKFDLVFRDGLSDGVRIHGNERPLSAFMGDDLGDRGAMVTAFLERMLGFSVCIETAEEPKKGGT